MVGQQADGGSASGWWVIKRMVGHLLTHHVFDVSSEVFSRQAGGRSARVSPPVSAAKWGL
jgi:hypothetical protein